METQEVKVKDKTFVVKELKWKDMSSLDTNNPGEASKKMLMLSTDITEEDYNELSAAEGLALMNVVNKINGLEENFTKPKEM